MSGRRLATEDLSDGLCCGLKMKDVNISYAPVSSVIFWYAFSI